MDIDTLAAEVHAIKVDLIAIRNDLAEVLGHGKESVDFIRELQTIVNSMADNPMLKAMGMGGMPKLGSADMPKLPGM